MRADVVTDALTSAQTAVTGWGTAIGAALAAVGVIFLGVKFVPRIFRLIRSSV